MTPSSPATPLPARLWFNPVPTHRKPRRHAWQVGCGMALLALLALLQAPAARAQGNGPPLKPITVARGLVHPWSLAFLPDGNMLVTERPGRMRIVSAKGRLSPPLEGLLPVQAAGQGGLLDVVLHPRFAENHLVYWSFSEPGTFSQGGGNSTAVARGTLDGLRLKNVEVIFSQQPKVNSMAHFGSRLVWSRDEKLFITLGERFTRKEDAQTLDTDHGKVVRVEADGKVPADNPFVNKPGARPEIWSYGHRNMQGAALNPITGELWTHEHGPQGGDEVNVDLPGRNYGWPVITMGRNYGTGTKIGEGTERADVEKAVITWVPSIAPSGMVFLTSDRYPGWQGNLFVGALRAEVLVRLQLDGRKVVREERLLTNLNERIRDVRQGPDGWLYVLTDNADGRVIRLER